ncbi:AAA domain-containing protein [Fodinicola acaciae]|uniref:AAA domain-containing protein n=1 Tax=Fodinicola acaciae TaxID=2681555 RepID=UPI001C9E5E9A|nr:AAA domain-containing protein [Fodinicola acaciae]
MPATELFDLVVFDEASQIEPHDAMTSIMRGRRLVLAGDDRQLPPSRWFNRMLADDPSDDSSDAQLSDFESILTSMRPIIPHCYPLRWHYRSQDERLIAFSNKEIYNGGLVTFPGTQKESPLRLVPVDGTASPGQDGSSPEEVRKVAELVLEHASQRPHESLGVITLGTKHQARVEHEIRQARANRPELDDFFADDTGPTHRFFVKNIETVQGDERDAIILSLGVARRANGTVSRTGFGALNREGSERRLNVAVTRARRRMTVVSCFGPAAIAPGPVANGTEMLRRYLEMIDHDGDVDRVGRSSNVPLNGFEEDIRRRLTEARIPVHPQWGFSGYRIDFALADENDPGRMVMAVEADGDAYHRSRSARDRDRLRQQHLERLGWRFHRVWASSWFSDPEAETARIVEAWRAAMRSSAQPRTTVPPVVTPPPATRRRGPRPNVRPGQPITEYSDGELISIMMWLMSDGLQRDRDSRIDEAMRDLHFRRRGTRIAERLDRAAEVAQRRTDRGEP